MKNKVIKIFNCLFSLFFGVIFINCIFNNRKSVIEFNMKTICIISILFLMMILGMVLLISRNKEKIKLPFTNKKYKWISIIIPILVIFTLQIIIASCFYYPVGWDVKILRESAKALACNEAVDYLYFQEFPNNVFLLWVFKYIYYISSLFSWLDYEFALVIFNIIIMDLGALITILISKKLYGLRLSIVTGILCSIFIIFSPWMNVVYSDTIGLFFPVLILYLYIKVNDSIKIRNKVILSILIGVSSVVAFQVKPTNIIILIAIFIGIFFFRMNNKKETFNYLGIIICIVISFVCSKYIYNKTIGDMDICGQKVSDNYAVVVPSTHFLMMGMQEQYNEDNQAYTYGSWSQKDYVYTFSLNGKNERIHAHVSEVKNRLTNFGVRGYVKFLYKKANWILHDGTFYYGGEGGFVYEEPSADNMIAEAIQQYYVPTNDGYVKTAYVYEALWLIVLLLVIFSFRNKENEREEIFILKLTITGIIIFLLFFEARSRYLINHVPIFILVSIYGFEHIEMLIKKYIIK